MVKPLKSDILLVCTWLLFLGLVIYFWLIKGLEPPTVLLVLLVIIALIPLAERLKIGNWFDFTRKVGDLSKEVSSTQKRISQIENVLISNIQGQQQFNISLLANEEVAEAIAELIRVKSGPSTTMEKISSAGEDTFFSEKMSPTDRLRFLFIDAADEELARVTPLIYILYYAKLAQQEHRRPKAQQVLDRDVISIIEELQQNWYEVFRIPVAQVKQYLENIKSLFRLREDVDKMKTEPPPVEEGKRLIEDVHYAASYLLGMISMGFTIVYLPSLLLEGKETSSES